MSEGINQKIPGMKSVIAFRTFT